MKKQQIEALWGHVHWLGVLADAGSYTAAAARLGVSKAAVSLRISELEAAAGVPLVRRTTRSLRLTEAGQGLVDATREAFVQIERSFAGVRELADTPRGLLRVTAPVALGRQHIVPLMPAFLRAYPELSIELDLSAQISSLARDGFDVAIRHVFQGNAGPPQVSSTPAGSGLGEARPLARPVRCWWRAPPTWSAGASRPIPRPSSATTAWATGGRVARCPGASSRSAAVPR